MPVPVEAARLLQSIEAFKQRLPRDLPKGVEESLDQIHSQLTEMSPGRDTPGSRAAAQAPGTEGTGVHFSKGARGVDGPSPGQKEFQSAGHRAALAQAALRGKANSIAESPPG